MTIIQTVENDELEGTRQGSFGTANRLVRVYDDAGGTVSIALIQASGTAFPTAGSAHPTYSGYYAVRIRHHQVSNSIVDIHVEYTNEFNFFDRDSADPQDVSPESPGFVGISIDSTYKYVDIWNRTAWQAFTAPNATTGDPGNVTAFGGDLIGAGTVDAAGAAISWPVLTKNVTVTLTRDLDASDPIGWSAIEAAMNTRYTGSSYLGAYKGTLLFLGANVDRTYATGTVSYSLNFLWEQFYHLRQRIDRDADGMPLLTADTGGNMHAENVYALQPHQGETDWTGLLTSEEYDMANGKVST